ncbi:MAG: hypothetical protein Kow0056_09560 [Coriobacteriia bacterium]
MGRTAVFWLVIVLVGVLTQAMRVVPMLAHERFADKRALRRALQHLPAAALAALAAPDILYRDVGKWALSVPQIAAGVVGLLVALRTKSMVWTMLAGLGVLMLLERLI